MFFPWTAFALLAVESISVINLRLEIVARGGAPAMDELGLMFAEKAYAAVEAGSNLMLGGTPASLVARYRFHVAENQARLAAAN